MSLNGVKKRKTNLPRRRQMERSNPSTSGSGNLRSQRTFHRNRTLTGTSSNNFDSVNSSINDFESTRSHVHRLSNQRRKVSSIILIVFLSTMALWMIVCNFTASATISLSDTTIVKSINTKKYIDVIQSYLDTNPISRFTFFTSNIELTKYVSERLPEVKNVTVRGMSGIGSTNFAITMRTPVAGWTINGKQYYVDSSGVPFEINYFEAPAVQIIDNSGASVKTSNSTAIASKRFLSFIGKVVSSAKFKGYTITEAILPSGTARELEIKIKENGFLAKLTIDRSAGEQVGDMSKAIEYFTARGLAPKYIDVRVSGKAYYM